MKKTKLEKLREAMKLAPQDGDGVLASVEVVMAYHRVQNLLDDWEKPSRVESRLVERLRRLIHTEEHRPLPIGGPEESITLGRLQMCDEVLAILDEEVPR